MVLNKKTGNGKVGRNRELEEISKGESIVKWIKGQRISWFGHLQRMEEDRMPKKNFIRELEGKRRRGRPRKVPLRMKNVPYKSCRETRNTHFVFSYFFFPSKIVQL